MTKDPDKRAVYEAEEFVFANTLFDELVTDADILELAGELFASQWWEQNKIPVPEIRLRRLDANASMASTYHPSSGRRPQISFTFEQVNAWTLAHEAAHIAQHHLCQYPYTPVEGHGLEFRLAYLAVTEILCGMETSVRLAQSFAQRVSVRGSSSAVAAALRAIPPTPNHVAENEGIFPRWRLRKQLAAMKTFKPAHDPIRINGAIPL